MSFSYSYSKEKMTWIPMNAIVGLFGLAIFVICVIGDGMMMEVMVNVTNDLTYRILFSHLHPILKFPLFFVLAIVQLCYFVLGSTRTVVLYLDLCAPILRVTSKLFSVCFGLFRLFFNLFSSIFVVLLFLQIY